jgi:hypothetical protein
MADDDRPTTVRHSPRRICCRAERSSWKTVRDCYLCIRRERAGANETPPDTGDGSVATAARPAPTLTLEADLSDQDEYEVRVYDVERGRLLVAAIEIVSPSNKDRPENRRAFVAKVAALLQKDVCVSVVDLVTIRQFNLYADLLELIGGTDPQLGPTPPHLYSVTIRSRKRPEKRSLLDMWFYPMTLGQPLPMLPIWLDANLRVLLPLEPSYEETCRLLHIA